MQRLSYAKEQIKATITTGQVIERYTGEKVRRGNIICPFHNEKTPSMSVSEHFYFCHACGAKGDEIGFVMKYHGADFKTAISIIDRDFCLGLTDQKVTVSQQIAIRNKQKELEHRQYIEAKQKREHDELAQRHWVAHVAILHLEPLSDLWCHYYNELQKMQYVIEKGGY